MNLSIPWSDLKNKPVRILIKNIHILAVPRSESVYDQEEEEERLHKLKMDKIETAELLSAKRNSLFISSLVKPIRVL